MFYYNLQISYKLMINAVISLSSVTQEQLEGKLPKGKSVRVAYCRQ